MFTLAFLHDDEMSKLSRILYDQAYGCAFKCIMLRVFQKNLFPDVEKDQNTQSVKVLDLNLKQDLPPYIKTTRFVKVKE